MARHRTVNTRVWDTESKPDKFPELHDPDFNSDWVKQRRDFGIVFSGGGTRSASATLGQLRGLRKAGLLSKAGYISAVSGGAWASTPYVFLPKKFSDDLFLGPVVSPENLTLKDLQYTPKGSLAHAISETVVGKALLKSLLKNPLSGDETYARVIGRLFLKPFGLDKTSKFFAFSQKDVKSSIKYNASGSHHLIKEDFYTARRNRPYFIAGSTILLERNKEHKLRKVQCEYTPIYSGVRKHFSGAGKFGSSVGGGYVQSYAYDSKAPEKRLTGNKFNAKLGSKVITFKPNRFTLTDLVGSTGAAPEEVLRKYLKLKNVGFPEFRHWSVHPVSDILEHKHYEYPHGDGGHLENFGLMPLLARKVKKIIVFINTRSPFEYKNNQWSYVSDLAPLFGRSDCVNERMSKTQLAVNKVFKAPELDKLIKAYGKQLAAGNALTHCGVYDVLKNDHYKIEPYRAKICWVYNSWVENWYEAITDSHVRRLLDNGRIRKQGKFKRFPHYLTFEENKPKLIDLTPEQVNMLAHLSCWNVVENADYIKEGLGFN